MLEKTSIVGYLEKKSFGRFAASALSALLLSFWFAPAFAQQPGQRTFASAEDGSCAFFTAMRAPDDQSLLSILGPAGEDVVIVFARLAAYLGWHPSCSLFII